MVASVHDGFMCEQSCIGCGIVEGSFDLDRPRLVLGGSLTCFDHCAILVLVARKSGYVTIASLLLEHYAFVVGVAA